MDLLSLSRLWPCGPVEKPNENLLMCEHNADSWGLLAFVPCVRSAAHVRFATVRSRAFGPMEKVKYKSAYV